MRRRHIILAGLIVLILMTMPLSTRAWRTQDAGPVTFNKDVLPILQNNCQSCHRPGQVAPMSFLSYRDARPWAKAMKAAIVTKKMPPWFADPQFGHFANARSLKPGEIEIISKWADTGAAEGNVQDAPSPIHWPEDGWEIRSEEHTSELQSLRH